MHFYEDPKLEQLEGQLLRQLFVRTVAPVYCLLIKMFDQLKDSRHELIFIADIFWLFQINAVIFMCVWGGGGELPPPNPLRFF